MATAKTKQKILEKFLELLADHSYEEVSMPLLADKAKVKLSELRGAYTSKLDLVRSFAEQIDKSVLDERDDEMGDQPARDRLFDVLMSRIDALAEHKEAVRAFHDAAGKDAALALEFNKIEVKSQRWMLIAAGIDMSGLKASVLSQGLAIAFSRVVRTWLAEEDEGMPRTMARLDKELDKGTTFMKRLNDLDGFARGVRSVLRGMSRKRRASKRGEDAPSSDNGMPAEA